MSNINLYTMSNLLSLISLIQGVVFGLVLILIATKKKPSKLMGFFLLTWGFSFLIRILANKGIITDHPDLFFLPVRFYFLSFPLLYLYVKKLMDNFSIQKDRKHLYPGLIEFFFYCFLFLFLSDESKLAFQTTTDYRSISQFYYLLANLFVVTYLVKILKLLLDNKKRVSDYFSTVDQRLFSGIKPIILGFLYMTLVSSVFIIAQVVFRLELKYGLKIYVALSFVDLILTYWLAIYGMKQYYVQMDSKVGEVVKVIREEVKKKNHDGFDDLFKQIVASVEETKCFKNTELTIVDLSNLIDIHYSKLSRVIKYKTDSNFSTFINRYRVEEAKQIMRDTDRMKETTLEVLGKEVGFKAESSFYNSFKKFEGITPAKFIKTL